MITNDFTICKAKVNFIFISKTQDINYNIENNVFSLIMAVNQTKKTGNGKAKFTKEKKKKQK